MVTRDSAWPSGTPCWVDSGSTTSPAPALFLLRSVRLGYPGLPARGRRVRHVQTEGRVTVAGIGPKQGPPGTPSTWTVYLASDEADQTASKITAAGGRILVAPLDVMDVGRMVVAADPAGAVFGVWQARSHTGMGLANEPGSVCWNETSAATWTAARPFTKRCSATSTATCPPRTSVMPHSSSTAGK